MAACLDSSSPSILLPACWLRVLHAFSTQVLALLCAHSTPSCSFALVRTSHAGEVKGSHFLSIGAAAADISIVVCRPVWFLWRLCSKNQKSLEALLGEIGYTSVPRCNSRSVCGAHLALRGEILQLHELRRQVSQRSQAARGAVAPVLKRLVVWTLTLAGVFMCWPSLEKNGGLWCAKKVFRGWVDGMVCHGGP